MYKGNYMMAMDSISKDDVPTTQTVQIINSLIDRVFNDVYISVGVPNAALGSVGDYAINVSTWTPYFKTAATTWTAQTAIDNNANAFLLTTAKR